jgi:alkanal monooxygenase alpha chain
VSKPIAHIFLTLAQAPGWTQAEIFDGAMEMTSTALANGYEGTWVLEHHFSKYGLCPSALAMSAFLLGRFPTLKVTTGVVVLPNIHPIQVAEQVAMLDQASGGRLSMGIGRGIFPRDFDIFARSFGVAPDTSHLAMRESMDLIERAWRGPTVRGDGRFYTFDEVEVYPKLRTGQRIPIYVAAESPSTIEWAAERGYGMALGYWLSGESIRSNIELYNVIAEQSGHDPALVDHAAACIAHVGDTTEAARAAVEPYLKWWREEGFRIGFTPNQLAEMKNYEFHKTKGAEILLREKRATGRDAKTLMDLNPIGDEQYCIDRLQGALGGLGIRRIICAVEGCGTREGTMENIARFKSNVLDKLDL